MFWKIGHNPLRTAQVRLTLLFALLFTALAGSVFVCVYWELSSRLTRRIDRMLHSDATELAALCKDCDAAHIKTYLADETVDEDCSKLFYRILDRDGTMIASSDLSTWRGLDGCTSAVATAPPKGAYATVRVTGKPSRVRIITMRIPDGNVVQIGESLELEDAQIKGYAEMFGWAFAVLIVPGTVLGWFITRRVMAGVQRVADSADHIQSEGDFSLRLPVQGDGAEIERLAHSFNEMLGRIQRLIVELRHVTDDIAHDLRSPVTRMRGVAETTLTGVQRIEDYREMAGIIIEESDRLVQMITIMLELSETEAGMASLNLQDVNLAVLARDAHDLFGPVAEDNNVRLVIETRTAPGRALARGDAQRLQRALANLLDNAIKYTPGGGTVTLIVHEDKDTVRVAVRDTGCGIAPEDLPYIFDRHYRADHSRSTSGSGLGLSLARAIARAIGGDLTVESAVGTGSTFTLIVPASSSQPCLSCRADANLTKR